MRDEAPMIRAAHEWQAARELEAEARRHRDQVIRQEVTDGMSMYRAAQIVGLSQQAIYKIMRPTTDH